MSMVSTVLITSYVRPIDGSGSWRQIPGRLKHITGSGKSEVFGTNAHGYIYRCKKPCTGEWEKVEGNLKQCDATFNSIVGVTISNAIYRRQSYWNMRSILYSLQRDSYGLYILTAIYITIIACTFDN